jgi:DNA polymerase-3 subunit epsilon
MTPQTAAPAVEHDVLLQSLGIVESSPNYRVLHRFRPRASYNEPPTDLGSLRQGLFVDVETTGLDTERDEIVELGLVPFTFDVGRDVIVAAGEPRTFFEQPAKPLTADIIGVTNITPEMVTGHRIPDDEVAAAVDAAGLIIAHSARFDRKMLERRFPVFQRKHWAYSQEEVPWQKFGVAGGALVNIAMSACGVFTEGAHRAAHDCQLGVHVLATAATAFELDDNDKFAPGRTAFSYMIESARKPLRRLRALSSPRWAASWLKANGYRARYVQDDFQYWYKDFPATATPEDIKAAMHACHDDAAADPDVQLISGVDRYSVRV